MNENTLMPFGKYKGQKLANVPAGYLLWLYDTQKCGIALREYIREALPFLRVQYSRRPYQQVSMDRFIGR
ncbi:MAG TPA: DUF3820 family protein [Flavitalea sp.]|nr:DUF3820 family protein [Flavitalea sp.]